MLFFLSFLLYLVNCECQTKYPDSWVPDGFCTSEWASGLGAPRHMEAMENGDIIVVEQQSSQVSVLWDADGNGRSDPHERAILARAPGLNHGLTVHGPYLYASSASTLFRWRYNVGDRKYLGEPQVVVKNIPSDGHVTRTPIFSKTGDLYLSLGSASNVDNSPIHARILRWNSNRTSFIPLEWSSGSLFANGLRNEVGLRFDSDERLWGVMNGMDNVHRPDLGGDIHNSNPSEQVNMLNRPGAFYGYPYCWAEWEIPNGKGKGKGTMWAADKFLNDGTHTDQWCRENVIPPNFSLHPHTAPLDIMFYYGQSFPDTFLGDAFVALHGSWNSNTPVGYRVERIDFVNGVPKEATPFFKHEGSDERWPTNNDFRPVSVTKGKCGKTQKDCLFISSDNTGNIVMIEANHTAVSRDNIIM